MASTLGKVNPFRYRGYIYDEETGLYYLRTRYYCAIQARFVNADTVISGNVYKYAHNNPIIRVDTSGAWDHSKLQGKVVDNLADYLEALVEYSIANQPWTHIGWHKDVRLDDFWIPLVQEYIEELRSENRRVEVEP